MMLQQSKMKDKKTVICCRVVAQKKSEIGFDGVDISVAQRNR